MRRKSREVEASVEETELENSVGEYVPGILAKCSKCGFCTESFGVGEGSIKRCLVLLREGCPNGESNFYIEG